MFRKKVYAYENSQGDKGIIIATSYKKAEQIYQIFAEYHAHRIPRMSVGECQRRRSLRLFLALFPDVLFYHVPGRTSHRSGKIAVRPEYRLPEVLL